MEKPLGPVSYDLVRLASFLPRIDAMANVNQIKRGPILLTFLPLPSFYYSRSPSLVLPFDAVYLVWLVSMPPFSPRKPDDAALQGYQLGSYECFWRQSISSDRALSFWHATSMNGVVTSSS